MCFDFYLCLDWFCAWEQFRIDRHYYYLPSSMSIQLRSEVALCRWREVKILELLPPSMSILHSSRGDPVRLMGRSTPRTLTNQPPYICSFYINPRLSFNTESQPFFFPFFLWTCHKKRSNRCMQQLFEALRLQFLQCAYGGYATLLRMSSRISGACALPRRRRVRQPEQQAWYTAASCPVGVVSIFSCHIMASGSPAR